MKSEYQAIAPVSTGGTTEEVVSLAEAKLATRLDSTSTGEDGLLSMFIGTGRADIEREGNISLLQKQFDLVRDCVPSRNYLKIPMSPLVSVDAVVGIDSTGGETALSTDAYTIDRVSQPGRLILNSGYSWPSGIRDVAGFRVRFTAGHSTSADGVPDPLRVANLKYVAHLYEHRGDGNAPYPSDIFETIAQFMFPEAG